MSLKSLDAETLSGLAARGESVFGGVLVRRGEPKALQEAGLASSSSLLALKHHQLRCSKHARNGRLTCCGAILSLVADGCAMGFDRVEDMCLQCCCLPVHMLCEQAIESPCAGCVRMSLSFSRALPEDANVVSREMLGLA